MDSIKFACPHCKQSIDAPLEAAGGVGDCPNCQKEITVPAVSTVASQPAPQAAAPQPAAPSQAQVAAPPVARKGVTVGGKNKIVRPVAGSPAIASPAAAAAQPKKKPGKSRVILTLILGIAIGYGAAMTQVMMGYGFGKRAGGSSHSAQSVLLTKDAWKARVQEQFVVSDNQVSASKANTNQPPSIKAFKFLMGDPGRTETVGEETHWYYDCSDGKIQVVLGSQSLANDLLTGAQINEPQAAEQKH